MDFIPYKDEAERISMIHKYNDEDYALIRMTPTMIEKNNLDANGILRDLLHKHNLVDYENLEHGAKNGISLKTVFINEQHPEPILLKFYRVNNSRGDRRFSIELLKQRMRDKEINEGDLIYISVFIALDGFPQLFVVNLTHNYPSEQTLLNSIGMDTVAKVFTDLKPKLQAILNGDYFDNSKGAGKIAPKDVGDTLEQLLGIETNNRRDADYQGLIEIKAKGKSNTLDTLFTLRPHFDGTKIAEAEPNDRSRVSAFTRMYGYASNTHPDCNAIYCTIGIEAAPQNNQGFFLHVDDEANVIYLMHRDAATETVEKTAFWTFDELRQQLLAKHPATLWIKAESRSKADIVQFKYTEIEFSRSPQFITFISLIKAGKVTYDWRGYTSKSGKYSGKNHGNAWRIKPAYKEELFDSIETISL